MARLKTAWDKLSMNERALFIKLGLLHGLTDLKDIKGYYNLYNNGGLEEILNKVNSSNVNFVQRLKDPNRKNIPDWESPTDRISTHKLSVGTDENGNHYIFPEVQEINGKLIDFTRPPYHRFAGEISAEMKGDTVRVPSLEDAIKFTESYKQYYPFNNGGTLAHKFDGELVGLSLNILLKDNTITNYHINTKEPISIKNADNYSDALGWIADWLSKRTNQLSNNERRYSRDDFLFNHDFGLLDVGQLVYDEEVKRMLSTPIIIDERKKDRYDIGNVNNVHSYEEFPYIKGVMESNYSYGDKKRNIEDVKDILNFVERGHYKQFGRHIYISPYGDESTLIHELNHSRDAYPQEKAIYKNRKLQEGVELDDYLDQPTEIYSRLMQFRKHNNINPEHKYTEKDLQELKTKAKDFNILNRYDDTTILYLLNDIAKNNVTPHNSNPFEVSNGTYLAAFGGPLVHKKSGKELGESSYIQTSNSTQVTTPMHVEPLPYTYEPRLYDTGFITEDKKSKLLRNLRIFNDSPLMGITRLVDPTGLLSIPDAAIDLYDLLSTPTTLRTTLDYWNGLASIASLIPGYNFIGDVMKVKNWQQGMKVANRAIENMGWKFPSFGLDSLLWLLTSKELESNQKSTGGPLYPFSFEKNPFLKTPVVRYDEGGQKQDASNPGGYTDEQLNNNYLIWKTYDPTGGLNFFNYIASQNSGNLARGEENEYWKEYLGLDSAVPLMNSNAYTEWDKQIEAQKKQNGELTSDFYGTTPRMDYNILALADTLMLGNMVRNYAEYDKMYDLPHIETVTEAYEQAKNILNNPNQWTFVNGEIPIGGYRYDSKTSETNPLGMLSHFGMKWVPEENALYMHDTYDFPNKVYKFTDIPMRPREMKIRSKINFDPTIGSWLLRSPVNYNTEIPVNVTKE